MSLYTITWNGHKWKTTTPSEAWGFIMFLFHDGTFDLSDPKEISKRGANLTARFYTGPEMPNIQAI